MATPNHVARVPPFPQKLNRSPSCKRSKYHLMGKVSIWFFESSAKKKCCEAKASQVSPVNSPLILAGTFWVFMTGLVMVTLSGTLLSSGIPETTLHSWKLVEKDIKRSWNWYQVPEISNLFNKAFESCESENWLTIWRRINSYKPDTAQSFLTFTIPIWTWALQVTRWNRDQDSLSSLKFQVNACLNSHEVMRSILNTWLVRHNWESQAGWSKALAEPSWIKSRKNLHLQMWQKSITAQRKSVPRLPPVPHSLGRRGNNASLSKNNPIFESKVLLWLLIIVHHF